MNIKESLERIQRDALNGVDIADIPLEVWGIRKVKRKSIVKGGKFYTHDGEEVLAPYYVRFEDDFN